MRKQELNSQNSKNNSKIIETINSGIATISINKPSRPQSTRPNTTKSQNNSNANLIKKQFNIKSNISNNVNNNLIKSDNKPSYKYESPYLNKNNIISPINNSANNLIKRPNSSKLSINNNKSNTNNSHLNKKLVVSENNYSSGINSKIGYIPSSNINIIGNYLNTPNQNNFLRPANKANQIGNSGKSSSNNNYNNIPKFLNVNNKK